MKSLSLTIEDRGSHNNKIIMRPSKREAPLFAVGGTVGKGRVLVLADHSIFINRMILPRETGNLEFAANCLHWLRGGRPTVTEAIEVMHRPSG